ncbi:MAG: hypothetical protein ACRDOC_12430 [Streptosporangiaceae bacterium]
MGRTTFVPALGAPPVALARAAGVRPDLSSPLPAGSGHPEDVVVVRDGPAALVRRLRSDRTFPDGSVELVYEVGRAALT